MSREDVRQLIEGMTMRWRGDTARVTERAGESMQNLFMQLGLATREELEELELHVAQLEHRLRLLEGTSPPPRR
jgi:polyhydroxyalkanoate synthesis regulator phasin